IDVLIHLQQHLKPTELTSFACYDFKEAWREARLFFEWYLPGILGAPLLKKAEEDFRTLFEKLYDQVSAFPQTLVLRDYHVDNLMRVAGEPTSDPLKRCGILDYQDACRGPLVYDLVSLLLDVRRDIEPTLRDHLIARYKSSFPTPPWKTEEAFDAAYT